MQLDIERICCYLTEGWRTPVSEEREHLILPPPTTQNTLLCLLVKSHGTLYSWRFKSWLAFYKVQNDNLGEIDVYFEC